MYFVKDALLDGDGNHHHTFAKKYDFCFRQRQSRARPTLPAPQLEHEMDQRLTLDREHLENSSSKKSLKGAGGQSKCSYIEVEAFSSPMQFGPGLGWLLSMWAALRWDRSLGNCFYDQNLLGWLVVGWKWLGRFKWSVDLTCWWLLVIIWHFKDFFRPGVKMTLDSVSQPWPVHEVPGSDSCDYC